MSRYRSSAAASAEAALAYSSSSRSTAAAGVGGFEVCGFAIKCRSRLKNGAGLMAAPSCAKLAGLDYRSNDHWIEWQHGEHNIGWRSASAHVKKPRLSALRLVEKKISIFVFLTGRKFLMLKAGSTKPTEKCAGRCHISSNIKPIRPPRSRISLIV